MNAATQQITTENYETHTRIKDRTLAIFDFAIPFHVIDMDQNGLVFRYVGAAQWFKNPDTIDIVHEGFSVKNLKVVSVTDDRFPTDLIQTRYHRVRFRELSPEQLEQLDHFLIH